MAKFSFLLIFAKYLKLDVLQNHLFTNILAINFVDFDKYVELYHPNETLVSKIGILPNYLQHLVLQFGRIID